MSVLSKVVKRSKLKVGDKIRWTNGIWRLVEGRDGYILILLITRAGRYYVASTPQRSMGEPYAHSFYQTATIHAIVPGASNYLSARSVQAYKTALNKCQAVKVSLLRRLGGPK